MDLLESRISPTLLSMHPQTHTPISIKENTIINVKKQGLQEIFQCRHARWPVWMKNNGCNSGINRRAIVISDSLELTNKSLYFCFRYFQ